MTREQQLELVDKVVKGELTELAFIEAIKPTSPDIQVNLIMNLGYKINTNIVAWYAGFSERNPEYITKLKSEI